MTRLKSAFCNYVKVRRVLRIRNRNFILTCTVHITFTILLSMISEFTRSLANYSSLLVLQYTQIHVVQKNSVPYNHTYMRTCISIAGIGVLVVVCMPLRISGRRPSLAAVNTTLEPPNRLPLAAPNVDSATSKGITTRPAVPIVFSPKG